MKGPEDASTKVIAYNEHDKLRYKKRCYKHESPKRLEKSPKEW